MSRARPHPTAGTPIVTALTLLYTMLAFCAVCILLCLTPLLRDRILSGAFIDLLTGLGLVYATPVSIVVAGVLPSKKRHAPVRYPRAAVVLLVMWNVILLVPFVGLALYPDMQAKDVTRFCEVVTTHWMFLISGVLAFTSARGPAEGP